MDRPIFPRRARFRVATATLAAIVAVMPALARAQPGPAPADRPLHLLSIEELMQVDVTSVSRTEESLQNAAAAISVVTNEDIRRSGATTIPEALRMVPGIFVGRRNSNSWAVSSRGFSSVNSEKLLVLSDTRSVYTPLFSGVFWDVQNYLMDDIDRIEVIRGPGASLWGSNAVNGVINIITKEARDTQGLLLEAGGGSQEHVVTAARYGGKIGDDVYYRVYGRYFDRDESFHAHPDRSDDWRVGQLGFRTDWYADEKNKFTFQGDGYLGNVGQLAPSVTIIGRPGPEGDLEVDVGGGNLLSRWNHEINDDSQLQVRAYYDRTDRNDPSFDDALDTFDLDVQHKYQLTAAQELIWGVNYRHTYNRNQPGMIFALEPNSSSDDTFGAFVQDRIAVTEDFQVTLGTKLEHNDFSGFEVQPSVRAAWQVAAEHVLWSAVSRAVRVPTRLERDVAIDLADPASDPLPTLTGNNDFDSEELIAYELGYRWQPLDTLAIDVAAYYNDYDELASLELAEPFLAADGRTIVPIINRNLTDGHIQGIETAASWSPVPWWRLTGIYSYIDIELNPDGMDLNRGEFFEGATPRHQLGLQSFLDLPAGFQLDVQARRVSAVRRLPDIVDGSGIEGYNEVDVRLGWRPDNHWEISVLGQNLLDDHHPEAGAPEARGQIERAVFAKVVFRH